MSAPATLPVWDSNGTNVSPTTPTHQTIGYANDEVPTAAELNYLLALYCAWIAWLNTRLEDAISDLSQYSIVKNIRLKDQTYSTGTAAAEAGFGTAPTRMVVNVDSAGPTTSAFFELGPTPTTDTLIGLAVEVLAFGGSPVLAVYAVNEGGGSGAPGLTELTIAEKTVTATGMISMTVSAQIIPTAFTLAVEVPAGAGITIGSVHMTWSRPTP